MNYFKKNYRELSENQDLLNEKRFVYQGGSPAEAPKKVEKPTEPSPQAPVEPLSQKDWQKHQERFNTHMEALKKADPKLAKKHEDEFKPKMEGFQKEYGQKFKDFGAKIAEKAVAPKVNELVAQMKQHIIEHKGALPEEKPAALAETEATSADKKGDAAESGKKATGKQ